MTKTRAVRRFRICETVYDAIHKKNICIRVPKNSELVKVGLYSGSNLQCWVLTDCVTQDIYEIAQFIFMADDRANEIPFHAEYVTTIIPPAGPPVSVFVRIWEESEVPEDEIEDYMESILKLGRRDRGLDIQRNPDIHRHNYEDLIRCCTIDGAIDAGLMDLHEGLGLGPKCDVIAGQCSCGEIHE